MSFSEQLKSHAMETGQYTIATKQTAKPAKKAANMNAFADVLKADKYKQDEPEPLARVLTKGKFPYWSFSSLKQFEACPYQLKLEKVDKEPRKENKTKDRGNQIHDMCQQFVEGDIDALTKDKHLKLDNFREGFDELRDLHTEGKVTCEGRWAIRNDWSPCDWNDNERWGRARTDVFQQENETSCVIIDYKTGRKFGNEYAHLDQGVTYGLHGYHRFPKVEIFKVSFWYLDQGEKLERTFNRRQLMALLPRYHKRANALTSEQSFIPKSNADACRYCPFGSNQSREGKRYGTGMCPHDFYRGRL